MYGVYRFSDRMSFSTRVRAGSNFPTVGYYESRPTTGAGQVSQSYYLSSTRNNRRVPVYSRLDVRASALGINPITHQVFGLFDSMFPLIPSAGLSMEF